MTPSSEGTFASVVAIYGAAGDPLVGLEASPFKENGP